MASQVPGLELIIMVIRGLGATVVVCVVADIVVARDVPRANSSLEKPNSLTCLGSCKIADNDDVSQL